MFVNDDNNDVYVSNKCNPYDEFNVKVTGYNDDDDIISTGEGTVLCTYVRREIRDYSDSDLSSIMDAMYAVWSISEDEGSERYGSDFHSASYFTQIHDFNSAWRDADHIHEGVGFLMQNVKISNMFEKAMQSIDKSVVLPYWDYSIDGESNLKIQDTILVSEDLFGNTSSPLNVEYGFTYENDTLESGAITSGRWAYLAIDKMETTLTYIKSGYGYLRAPWSMNPSPYVSRFALSSDADISLPSCDSHYSILNEDSMMSFFSNLQYDPHHATHMMIGGVYGCDKFIPFLEQGYITSSKDMYNLCIEWVSYLKEFYRSYNIIPNQDCLVATDGLKNSNCGFECVHDTKATLKSSLQKYLNNYVSDDLANNPNHSGWDEFFDFICSGDGQKIYPGDSYQSSSPSDPIHHVIYPTLDRIFHAKLLSDSFLNETWSDNSSEVCEKNECYSPFTPDEGAYKECCDGHYSTSQLLDHTSWNRCSYIGDTNAFTLKSLDPRTSDYSMNYIYDSFQWTHCGGSSNDIDSLLSGFASNRLLSNIMSKSNDDVTIIPLTNPPTPRPTHLPSSKPTNFPTQLSTTNTKSFC